MKGSIYPFRDNLGNPRLTQFSKGAQVEYVYIPTEQKVREIHRLPKSIVVGGTLPAPHEMDSDISPYAFCANNPVNVTDPDGNLVIFINGFDTGDGSSTDYWEGKDRMIMDILDDHNAMYLDGSPSHWLYFIYGDNSFDKRTDKGEEKGFELCYDILKATKNDETIKIVTHSMGATFAKGFLKGLEKYLKETNRVETISSIVEMEIDLAPYEPDKQQAVEGISTVTISHTGDKIAGTKPIKGVKNIVTEHGYATPSPHSITTFTSEEIQKAVRMIK